MSKQVIGIQVCNPYTLFQGKSVPCLSSYLSCFNQLYRSGEYHTSEFCLGYVGNLSSKLSVMGLDGKIKRSLGHFVRNNDDSLGIDRQHTHFLDLFRFEAE